MSSLDPGREDVAADMEEALVAIALEEAHARGNEAADTLANMQVWTATPRSPVTASRATIE
jgi:hypothetical protein